MDRLIEENGGTAKGLDLSGGNWFQNNIDLRELDLEGIVLKDAGFFIRREGDQLVGAHLEGANLSDAHLEGAVLIGAHLEGAHLVGAYLGGANLRDAHLEGAHLVGAHLGGANLRGVHLEGAFLIDYRLSSRTRLENIDWGNYKIGEEVSGDFYSAERLYRQLKMWYTNAGISDIAAKFYYREKEAARKGAKRDETA